MCRPLIQTVQPTPYTMLKSQLLPKSGPDYFPSSELICFDIIFLLLILTRVQLCVLIVLLPTTPCLLTGRCEKPIGLQYRKTEQTDPSSISNVLYWFYNLFHVLAIVRFWFFFNFNYYSTAEHQSYWTFNIDCIKNKYTTQRCITNKIIAMRFDCIHNNCNQGKISDSNL